jgi:hypothetical protein
VLLLHVPLPDALVSTVVEFAQTCSVPPIAAGAAFTVTALVTKQPPAKPVIVTPPADKPVTTPVEETGAIEGLLLLQVTPGVALDKVIDAPSQTEEGPLIAAGPVVTVTSAVVVQPAPNE